MTALIRLAREADSVACARIYAPYVERTIISFEERPPSPREMSERINRTLKVFPWVVYEQDGDVIGYAYAGHHSDRPAYRWSTDASVYVDQEHHRAGVGRNLYTTLFEALRIQGYYCVNAGISLPNSESAAFHESLGFQHLGTFREVGFKFGRWIDVGWWQSDLQPRPLNPQEPKVLAQARTLRGWPLPT